jgi:hypothetical protein
MAEHAPVLFIEEPIFLDDVPDPRLDITVPFANVFRAIPHLPGARTVPLRESRSAATRETAARQRGRRLHRRPQAV